MTSVDKVYLVWKLDKTKTLDANVNDAIVALNSSKDLKDEVPWTIYFNLNNKNAWLNWSEWGDRGFVDFKNKNQFLIKFSGRVKPDTIKIESA